MNKKELAVIPYSFYSVSNCHELSFLFRLAGFLAMTACLGLAGCRPPPPASPLDHLTIIKEFFGQRKDVAEVFSIVKIDDKAKFAIEVDIDHTLSMDGYVKGAKEPDSAFFKLLRQFANQGELIGFNAFGTSDKDPRLVLENLIPLGKAPPLDVNKYDRLNNDYAAVIKVIADEGRQKFSDGKPIQHLLITDGVQSDKDSGHNSALSKTVQELQSWIQRGGAVELRVATTPFDGKYYSEDLRILKEINAIEQTSSSKKREKGASDPTSFDARSKARPFLVMGLISDRSLLPSWKKFWDRCDAVAFPKTAVFPPMADKGKTIQITPLPTVSKDFCPELVFEEVWALKTLKEPGDKQNLYAAEINNVETEKSRTPTDYPVCFQIGGLTGTLPEQFQSFLKCRPVLRVWKHVQVEDKPAPGKVPAAQKGGAPPVEPVFHGEWQAGPPLELPDAAEVEKFARLTDEGLVMVLHLPLPGEDSAAEIITLEAEQPKLDEPEPDFAEFSCGYDSKPDTIERIYNLNPLVKQLTEVIGQPVRHTGCLIVTHR